LEEISLKIRNSIDLGEKPIRDIIEVAELMGFTLINMNYQEDKVDAFSSMNTINGNSYFIITTGDSGSFYRQQFSIAHEIGHWVLHQNINPQELDKDEYKVIEEEANKFASALLLPKDSFFTDLRSKVVDE